MARQLLLDNKMFKNSKLFFGGEYLKNSNPKTARPISVKNAMHVVLRSSHAKKQLSFLSKSRCFKIQSIINKQAKKFNIKIYSKSINSNHIHLLIKLNTRDSFSKFIKVITSRIACITMGVKKGKAKYLKFWDSRPYSRIISWGKAFTKAKEYVEKNILEACGMIEYYRPTKNKTKVT